MNFGRVRGIFLAPPFGAGRIGGDRAGADMHPPERPASGRADIACAVELSAATLDRRLTRLARENGVKYTRYADDITLSTTRRACRPRWLNM